MEASTKMSLSHGASLLWLGAKIAIEFHEGGINIYCASIKSGKHFAYSIFRALKYEQIEKQWERYFDFAKSGAVAAFLFSIDWL